ncbi:MULTISPECIES: M23 family metallopeptidase [unclassified Salinivibrio]|uniref:M23 family metallopeptidase n=1 Tax=unclassified Salinivibrio TaxID=2636825 RepID=UPI0009884B1E|nr:MULTISPECIES: peptidoglycan DD-metalloendopeptidase family protein [unclassified Salinivibrio]MPS33539.1 peptidase M23 [Salinivibrio sp. VYel7]MPX94922.1 peptidase M23 [Salinivibrio sp. VYel9]MPX97864.1 peptidase M23 [Salinivibrio sp. VYel6]MPY01152.1 peptidase M23 [Salinivibrio sp. VYel4]MPY04228.1 peptidase M23 [Salinivibrio sp. VYel5]
MTDHIHIAISHPNGVKHYTLCPTRKKVVQTLALVLLAVLTVTFASLYLLSERSTEAEAAVNRLREERAALNNEVAMLQQKRDELSQTIENKDVELTALTQRVVTVEDMLGLQSVAKDASLTHRLDVAAINSAVRYTMLQLIPNGKPIQSYRRSSGYGSRTHPVTGKEKFHMGLDLTADIGTPVYAPADGVVEYVRPSRRKGYGNFVKIDHAFGFMTLYAHLDKFNVRSGQFVKKGDLIAWSGNTGLSTGPHLHYEVRFLGRALNPRRFIKWSAEQFDTLLENEKRVSWGHLVAVVENLVETQVQVANMPDAEPPLSTAQQRETDVQTTPTKASM